MTFPDVPRQVPRLNLGMSTFPDNLPGPLKGIWDLGTSSKPAIYFHPFRTLPDERPIQTGPIGGGLACLKGIALAFGKVGA